MSITNVEIKAKSNRQHEIREILLDLKADFKGEDHQLDTYFNVNRGRLKLREGNIENNLIHYLREDKKGPKKDDISLYRINQNYTLKSIITEAVVEWEDVE